MTPAQKEIARHMLGLPNKRKQSYRNHFCAGEGHHDYQTLLSMKAAGWLRHRPARDWIDELWHLTSVGALLALEKGERLDIEDFPTPEERRSKHDLETH